LGLSPAQVVGVMTEILKACSSELGVVSRQLSALVEFSVDFYDRAGIWIVEYQANV
jgi:hypothetical protein